MTADGSTGVVALTLRLVAAPSPNPPGDERAVVTVMREYLEDLPGTTLEIVAPRPERPSLVVSAGEGERALILAVHLDTHPITGHWQYDPLGERVGDRLYGRGTTDIKGAAAAMAVAFRNAVEHGLPAGCRLIMVANADEETGGAEGAAVLCAGTVLPLAPVIVAEPSGVFEPWETLYIAARGTTRFTLDADGTRTHSSLAGRAGIDSALERLTAAIECVRRDVGILSTPHPVHGIASRLTVVRLVAGEGYGVVPSAASAEIELRVAPGAEQEKLEREVSAIAEKAGVTCTFAEGSLRWMAPSDLPVDHPLVSAARAAWMEVLGVEPDVGCFPGGTDSRLFAASGRPALGGVGPGALVRAHHPDEYVDVDELDTAVALYGAMIRTYFALEGTA